MSCGGMQQFTPKKTYFLSYSAAELVGRLWCHKSQVMERSSHLILNNWYSREIYRGLSEAREMQSLAEITWQEKLVVRSFVFVSFYNAFKHMMIISSLATILLISSNQVTTSNLYNVYLLCTPNAITTHSEEESNQPNLSACCLVSLSIAHGLWNY